MTLTQKLLYKARYFFSASVTFLKNITQIKHSTPTYYRALPGGIGAGQPHSIQCTTTPLVDIQTCTVYIYIYTHTHTHRVPQEECAILRESVPYVKLYRYNPKHLYPKLNGYGDNGQRSLKL